MARFLMLLLLFALLPAPAQAEDTGGIAVIELYTSAGCGDAPVADRILQQIVSAQDKNVIALGCHVTGYGRSPETEDDLALEECNKRQSAYRGKKIIQYAAMPQMVINGAHVTGGKRENIVFSGVEMAKSLNAIARVGLTQENGKLTVALPALTLDQDVDVWLLGYDTLHSRDLPHGGGEDGRQPATVEYVNAVRSIQKLEPWNGHPATMAVPPDLFPPADHYAVIVQERENMKIIAAGKTD